MDLGTLEDMQLSELGRTKRDTSNTLAEMRARFVIQNLHKP